MVEEFGAPEAEELALIERDLERRRANAHLALAGEAPTVQDSLVQARRNVGTRRRRAPNFEDLADPSSSNTNSDSEAESHVGHIRNVVRAYDTGQRPRQRQRRYGPEDEAEEVNEEEAEAEAAAAARPARRGAAPRVGAGGRRIAPDIEKVIAELGHPDPPSRCFGCTHGREDSASIAYEPYRRMETLFQSKLSTADDIELARILANYFEKAVRQRANANRRDGEEPVTSWTAATIYFHFRSHIDDFAIKRHGRIRMMDNLVYRQYTYNSWTSQMIDGEEQAVPDPIGWKVLKEMLHTEARLYGQNPRTAMFSTSGVGLSSEEARPLVNMSKRRVYSTNTARFSGTSIAARSSNAGVGSTVQGAGAKRTTGSY